MTSRERFTVVDICYLDGRVNYRLLFGAPVHRKRLDRGRSMVFLKPSSIAGYLRWRANSYGTQSWRCFVVRTVNTGRDGAIIPGVRPCADILLATRGQTYTKRFLKCLDVLKRQKRALKAIPCAYWRHLHLRLHLNMPAHELSAAQWHVGSVKNSVGL